MQQQKDFPVTKPKEKMTQQMANDYQIDWNDDKTQMQIQKAGSPAILVLCFNEDGLEIKTHQEKLSITASKEIEFKAPKISFAADKEIYLHSAGNLVQAVAKDVLLESGGSSKNIAAHQKIIATSTNVELKANDDVRLDGERVLLNS